MEEDNKTISYFLYYRADPENPIEFFYPEMSSLLFVLVPVSVTRYQPVPLSTALR